MAVALDASTPAAVYGDSPGTTSLVTASFTPPTGTVIVAHVFTPGAGLSITGVTSSGPTFTARVSPHNVASHGWVAISTAIGTGAAITVTASFSGTGDDRALVVSVFSGAQLAATPATNVADSASAGAPSSTITTAAANSVVDWMNDDFNAVDGTSTRAYRSSATETSYHFIASNISAYTAYQAAATAGSQTYGLTAPTGQAWTLAAIEIQASAAAPTPPAVIISQAINRASRW